MPRPIAASVSMVVKSSIERGLEFGFDDGLNHGKGFGCDAVLQRREFAQVIRGQGVDAGAEELAELE